MTRRHVVRPARPEDMDCVFQIRVSVEENHLSMQQLAARGITPPWMQRLLDEGALAMWCAEQDARVVAFCAAKLSVREIYALFVLPRYQGQGIGAALLDTAVSRLMAKNRRSLRLSTGFDTYAHRFYLRRGWREEGLDAASGDVVLRYDAHGE